MIENEQVDVECERVDINRIVTDCLIEKYYEFREIQPTIQTENTPVWIYGNNLICKRIIENLIVNALRYSDNYIEVSINQKGVFTIKNSTKSLDDIDVNLLFNKFYTVDKSRTKGSSGLGLYIVKELLKKIDGKIENVSYEKNILSISICFPLYNDKKLL
ncbi:HAMP domain-containing sensor histidine kinase [Coprococcus comes]|uniref:sensor histidine kinase n=1 Tax=Coprococcus comes TaxID=410072 RepID=UPI00232DDC4E|nr:HAMP domain-containing sensor histidine kinase [Coprococcus comes]MDC0786822.1 HAMP domain-containing sensor histidine kinase [Coprococcus comes]MDC0790116.1 HAMP domain-containing sensor histidine kinase [Coprococcus comes]MDC0793264.1 HAMP domain-containing sensor histidine kinase [Coprococcus comes]MDC0797038.1 HAMP domain-containing sensor histidine kinase [Coprococcus comes]